jgi:hypothetical protein
MEDVLSCFELEDMPGLSNARSAGQPSHDQRPFDDEGLYADPSPRIQRQSSTLTLPSRRSISRTPSLNITASQTGTRKPLWHIIIGIDKEFEMIKIAWGCYRDGDDPTSIRWYDIHNIHSYEGAPQGSMNGMRTPTVIMFPTSDKWRNFTSHSYRAQTNARMARQQTARTETGFGRHSKPTQGNPESKRSWVNVPGLTKENRQSYSFPDSLAKTISYLKDKCQIKHDEDIDVEFPRWAFETINSNPFQPYQPGADLVSADSKVRIVFGCPVNYDRLENDLEADRFHGCESG